MFLKTRSIYALKEIHSKSKLYFRKAYANGKSGTALSIRQPFTWYDRGCWCVRVPLTHIFSNIFHTGKSLSSSPTVFDMNSQESDDTEKSAAGFGGKLPPIHMQRSMHKFLNAVQCPCPKDIQSKSRMAERSWSLREDKMWFLPAFSTAPSGITHFSSL